MLMLMLLLLLFCCCSVVLPAPREKEKGKGKGKLRGTERNEEAAALTLLYVQYCTELVLRVGA